MARLLRLRTLFAAATLVAATVLVSVSAQAACDGGSCPIAGGSYRTQVGAGFVQPFAVPLTPPQGKMNYLIENPGPNNPNPNTANGAVLPIAGASLSVPPGQSPPNNDLGFPAYSVNIPSGQFTWGVAASPPLLKVPLRAFVPDLLGLSTRVPQSWPGIPDVIQTDDGGTTAVGGVANFRAGGRSGAAVVTYCVAGLGPVNAAWNGNCNNFTPIHLGGPAVSAFVRYTATSNQFGGPAYQRQVMSPNWIGQINFNDPVFQWDLTDLAQTSVPKIFPTLPQNLVQPQAWGGPFRGLTQRAGAPPGNRVSGFLTAFGAAQVGPTTFMVTAAGAGQGLAQTSTSWGAPWTTGKITVKWITVQGSTSQFTHTGNDQRVSNGEGGLNLIAGSIAFRTVNKAGANRHFVTLNLPEPSLGLGLFVGIGALAALARRRNAA